MKKKGLFFSFLLFIFCSFNLLAENFPQKASNVEDFIPKGWKSIIVKKGDLNKDKIDDVVLLIQKNDPKNFRKVEQTPYGSVDNADFNPIVILVLFKDTNSQYNLVAKNDKGFIPSEGKVYEKTLETIVDEDSISIKNNTLRIYTFWEGPRAASSSTNYVFRYQNNRFELIGLEIRSGGNSSYTDYESFVASINFSTKKLIKTKETGKYDSDEKSKIDKKEKTININKNYILENMTEETANEILEKYGN